MTAKSKLPTHEGGSPDKEQIRALAGRRIKLLRKLAAGLTQEELCSEALFLRKIGPDFTSRTLRRYENRGQIPLKHIKVFAEYFGISWATLTAPDLGDDDVLRIAGYPGGVGRVENVPGAATPSVADRPRAALDPLHERVSLSTADVLSLLFVLQRQIDFKLSVRNGELCFDGETLPCRGEHLAQLSSQGMKSRIALFCRRLGFPNVSLDALIPAWEHELSQGAPLARNRLIERAREAAVWRMDQDDSLSVWRGAVERRLHEKLPTLRCVDRFAGSPPPEDLERVLELDPLLRAWPSRLINHREWCTIESPLPDIEPMHLDDVWVDLRMAGLREAGSPLHKLDLLQSMDNRYEEQQWVSEPAPFVLEKLRGSAALIGAPGIGKTTLLKWIARRLITQPDGRFLLPFYVPLRAYSLESGDRKGLLSFALRRCGISHPHQIQRWKNVLSYLSGRPISSDSSS